MFFFRRIAVAAALGISLSVPAVAQKIDALELYRNGKYAEAIAVCKQEIQQNPKNVNSYVVLCWSLVSNRQYAEAEARAIEARNISSTDTRLIEILAEAKYYQGKNDGALEFFQLYLANASQNSKDIGYAYLYIGEIYIRQAKYQHADIALSMAVHIKPVEYATWWARCGYAREMAGAYASALVAYNKALELDKSLADAIRGKDRVTAKLQ